MTLLTGAGFAAAESLAAEGAGALARAGALVVRTKIEAGASSPLRDGEPSVRYFELHALVRVAADQVDELRRLAEAHGARLSRRARRTVARDCAERYVNQRALTADSFGLLLAALDAGAIDVRKVHRERVLVDTNLARDERWLPVTG